MYDGLLPRKMICYGTMLMLAWSLMPMGLPVAYSQQAVPTEPIPKEQLPTRTPTEAEQPREAERVTEAERGARAASPKTRIERKEAGSGETYVAGFVGYTLGGDISEREGTGFPSQLQSNDRDLAGSVVYGGKIGHFFSDGMDWLGVEMEAFNTTPNVKQDGQLSGSYLRVTTLAFNVIGRLKFGCETKTERTKTRAEREGTARDVRYETRYKREFCRLQPYGGVGLGVFFANRSNNGNSVSDNGAPGLNALGGLRYYFTERIALFGEYKYNFAGFDFSTDGHSGGAAGSKGNYQVNHIVAGLSVHF